MCVTNCLSDEVETADHPKQVAFYCNEESDCSWILQISRSGSCDRGNFFRHDTGMMSFCSTPPVLLKWSEWFNPSLPKKNQEHQVNMSQASSDSRDASSGAPKDANYPPQHHAGAVGLGPEFGKGAVRTCHHFP